MKRVNDLERFPEFDNHEALYEIKDKKSGLHAFIAIHNTNLGPATGGTRFFSYMSRDDAIADALRLSKAMTYKCALADVKYGGGKGIIIGDPEKDKNEQLLIAYAEAVNELDGSFTTGEDVGLTNADIMVLSRASEYVHGLPAEAGDTAPWAALGVLNAIKAAVNFKFSPEADIECHTFAVKGLGKVGMALSKLLDGNGARIIGADINPRVVESVKKQLPKIEIVDSSDVHASDVDVYCPCALGNEFNEKKVSELNCAIVCGAANNQLESDEIGTLFSDRDITYVPDYVANAGGLINIVSEIDSGGYDRKKVEEKVSDIMKTTLKILKLSEINGKSTIDVANELAEEIINPEQNK
jgi:leucine dehydrogenase